MTKPKKKAAVVTQAQIAAASKSSTVQGLLKLSQAFHRAGMHGPFALEIRLFCAMFIQGKGYRKGELATGVRLNTENISIGKRGGLIFKLTPADSIDRNGEPIQHVDVSMDDISNCLPELSDQMDKALGSIALLEFEDIAKKVEAAIKANPSMHKVLSDGFEKAQAEQKSVIIDEKLEALPGFGAF